MCHFACSNISWHDLLMIYGLMKERTTSNGQGELPKMAKNTSKITTGGQAAVSKQLLNRSMHILLCSWSSLGPSSCQFPSLIGERREIHFSKREAWLACAGRTSAVGIGTEHANNLGAAHTRSGGRKQPLLVGSGYFCWDLKLLFGTELKQSL